MLYKQLRFCNAKKTNEQQEKSAGDRFWEYLHISTITAAAAATSTVLR